MIIKALSFLITLFFAAFVIVQYAHGQEQVTTVPTTKPSQSAITSTAKVQYYLAYPGMLPDNPLYKLKVLRDKITQGTISDTKKKVEFYLLQTDKGILAAAMLVDKGKIDLAAQTALKAENNYTVLIQELYRFDSKPNNQFFKKLHTASLKHQEVIKNLLPKIPRNKQKTFLNVIDFSKRNWQSVQEYIDKTD